MVWRVDDPDRHGTVGRATDRELDRDGLIEFDDRVVGGEVDRFTDRGNADRIRYLDLWRGPPSGHTGNAGDRRGCGSRRGGADGGNDRAVGDRRERVQPRQRSGGEPQSAEADVEKGSHDHRVELAAGASGDLLAGEVGGEALLVGPRRRDDVVGISDRDDATGEVDLFGRESEWIATAIPTFVVLVDRVQPIAQPVRQRIHVRDAGGGVGLDERELLVGRPPWLVQDLARDVELAEVVEEGGPVEPVELLGGKLEFLGDHVGVGADSFAVPAGESVVIGEGGEQFEQVLPVGAFPVRLVEIGDALLHLAGGAGTKSGLEAVGRFVGEHQTQSQERGEWQEASSELLGLDQHQGGERDDADPPDIAVDADGRMREIPGREERGGERCRHRQDQDDEPKQPGEGRAPLPPLAVGGFVVHLGRAARGCGPPARVSHTHSIGKSDLTLSGSPDLVQPIWRTWFRGGWRRRER